MATSEQKAFCVLQFAKTESVVTVQRAFRIKFGCDPPSDNNIRRWFHQFEDTGCLCKGKSTGRPRVSEEDVERVRESFTRSPKKSVNLMIDGVISDLLLVTMNSVFIYSIN
ncbi:hypothetical protein LSTR_LSTR003965 [Laodelphax striatellus]|uniref:DUF4817 domain-containing protein n=1 Tax=Laodelphax striatellus TaxID=195883 RepID=A0A482WFP4_LAOST|nr:hypothetical protein LSTR_LSTR003965 [Laodelphax striatellus]